jgi:hypothetical protein
MEAIRDLASIHNHIPSSSGGELSNSKQLTLSKEIDAVRVKFTANRDELIGLSQNPYHQLLFNEILSSLKSKLKGNPALKTSLAAIDEIFNSQNN